jgi:hypothetical protein
VRQPHELLDDAAHDGVDLAGEGCDLELAGD